VSSPSGSACDSGAAAAGDHADVRRSHAALKAVAVEDVLEAAADATVIVDDTGHIVSVNRRAELLFGLRREALVGETVERLLPPRLRSAHVGHRSRYVGDPSARPMGPAREGIGLRGDGTEFPVEVSLMPIWTSAGVLIAAAIRDVTDRKLMAAAVAHRALHDGLTDLPNRLLLSDRLDRALGRAASTGSVVAVLFIDIDHFKVLNDSRGYATGDALLGAIAQRLQSAVGPTDTLARFGGDEFVVVREGADPWAATRLAEDVTAALHAPFVIDGTEVFTSATIGIALASGDSSSHGLLRDADTAMCRAKQRGRGGIGFFDDTLRVEADARLTLHNALHRALDRNEFHVVYQPIMDVAAGTVVGMEALARWTHPDHGAISPAVFIPLAEKRPAWWGRSVPGSSTRP